MAESRPGSLSVEARLEELEREVASLRKRSEASETATAAYANPLIGATNAAASSSTDAPRPPARGAEAVPGSLHQLTAACCVEPESHDGARALYLLASFSLLYVQTQTLLGFMQGASNLPCTTNDDCLAGWLCHTSSNSCVLCNDNATNDGLTAWWAGDANNATEFCAQPDLAEKYPLGEAGCEACFDASLGGHDWNLGRNSQQEIADAFASMRTQDWFASVVISMVVGLSVAAEVQDIKLCQFMVDQRSKADADADAVPGWATSGLFVLAAARQFGLTFTVLLSVASLVTWRGSDAINVCFNAIAVLFILDLDNLVFQHFVPHVTQTKLLTTSRPKIGDDEQRILVSARVLTTVVWFLFCVASTRVVPHTHCSSHATRPLT